MNKLLTVCCLVVAVVFGLIFHLKNGHSVLFDYYVGQTELSLSWLLFATLCCGAILGILVSLPIWFKLKFQNYRLLRQQKKAELDRASASGQTS